MDTAKAYGILLVFYGHFAEKWGVLGSDAALLQWKFIYAFHMPLFFFLAGYVHRPEPRTLGEHLYRGLLLRIIPAFLFNLLAALYLIGRRAAAGVETEAPGILFGVLRLFSGKPVINFLTWFLVCLFTVELFHFLLGRKLTSMPRMALGAILSYTLGWLTWRYVGMVVEVTGIPVNFWYLHEAVVAYGLFLAGAAARAAGVFDRPRRAITRLGLLVASAAVAVATFGLNAPQGAVRKTGVIMATGQHGDFFLFPFTALVGIAMVAWLALLTPALRPISWLGRNTLVLFGLNGVLWTDNPLFAQTVAPYFADTLGAVLLGCALVTTAQVAACVPVVWLLNRLVPQLVGRPRGSGPILKALL
ncbi:MAG: acyltransferase family protein [Nitrospirae bacterium]|nr:acyltransferase family protein [Nitrospirota bacterium]